MTFQHLWVSFFGTAARRVTFEYLTVVSLVLFLLLATAWTVDLAKNFQFLRNDALEQDISIFRLFFPYMTYRAADILVRLFPVGCYFGIFIAEILRRGRLETVVLSSVGVSPLRLVAPIVIFGLVAGAFLYKLEESWRPAAIWAQVDMGHGEYSRRFASHWMHEPSWFLYGDVAVKGQVYRGDPPAMRNVQIFFGLQQDKLDKVYAAETMTAGDTPKEWHLSNVTIWDSQQTEAMAESIPNLTVELALIREELVFYGVPGFYLPNSTLSALTKAHIGSRTQIGAEAATWRRYVVGLVPFVVGFLAVSLARLGYTGRTINVSRMLGFGAAGYICVVSLKVFFAIGEIGGLSAPMATLGPLLILLAIAGLLTERAS